MFLLILFSIVCATPEQLGYDNSIQRCRDPFAKNRNQLCYVYKVEDRFFKTLKCLWDRRSYCVTGRGIRVWEVEEVSSFDNLKPVGTSSMVLKDIWLDEEAQT